MEITNRTGIEKPSWAEVSFLSIGFLVFYLISRVTASRLNDFADLCDPQEMGSERNEYLLAEYMNLNFSKDTDFIQFGLDNKSVLPKLYTMARQVLCAPASSAASETVFSTAGHLLEKRRTTLSPATVNSHLFLHSNME